MERMSRFGIGPIFAFYSMGLMGLMATLRKLFPSYFSLFGFHETLQPIALAWTGLGMALWLWSVMAVQRAYRLDRLCTTGPFRLCRHPLYSSFAVFILPGSLLLLDTWLAVVAAIILIHVVKHHGRVEEEYLRVRFGAPYEDYRNSVPAVLPVGKLSGL